MLHMLRRMGADVLSVLEFCHDLLGVFEIFG
jgi:hypothetical protein